MVSSLGGENTFGDNVGEKSLENSKSTVERDVDVDISFQQRQEEAKTTRRRKKKTDSSLVATTFKELYQLTGKSIYRIGKKRTQIPYLLKRSGTYLFKGIKTLLPLQVKFLAKGRMHLFELVETSGLI